MAPYQDEWQQAPAEAAILSKEEMGIEDDAMSVGTLHHATMRPRPKPCQRPQP